MLLLGRTSLSEDGEEAPLFFPPLAPQKGYPDKKVERGWAGAGRWWGAGGRRGGQTRGDTAHREISFPAVYGENSISWENLAERWEIYPANIDNHLFIS